MRLRIVVATMCACMASGLMGGTGLLPRSVLAYAEVRVTPAMQEFLDLGEAAEVVKSEILPQVEGLELGLVYITANHRMPLGVAGVLSLKQPQNFDWFFKIVTIDKRERRRKAMRAAVKESSHAGVTVYDIADLSLCVALIDKRVFLATREADLKALIDAAQGKVDAGTLLASDPKYTRFAGRDDGASVRMYADPSRLLPAIDAVIAPLAQKDRDLAACWSSREWAEWGLLDYVDASFEPGQMGSASFFAAFSKAPRFLSLFTQRGGFTSLGYLPPSTYFVQAMQLGKLHTTLEGLLGLLEAAQAAAASGSIKHDRGLFNERLQPVEQAIGFVLEVGPSVAFRRAAVALRTSGQTAPWSGSVAELAKKVGDKTLEAAFLGYAPQRVEGLGVDARWQGFSGNVTYAAASGHTLALAFEGRGRVRVRTTVEPTSPQVRSDGLTGVPLSEIARALVDAAMCAAGIERKELADIASGEACYGCALDPLRLKTAGVSLQTWEAREFSDRHLFAIIGIKDAARLERIMANVLSCFDERIATRDASGQPHFVPVMAVEKAKVLKLGPTFAAALTHDALLIGPPGLVLAMLGKARPATIATTVPADATSFVAWDLGALKGSRFVADAPLLPFVAPDFAELRGSAVLSLNKDSIELRGRHNLEQVLTLEAIAGSTYCRDDTTLRDFYDDAIQVYEERLNDQVPDNDRFPTIKDVVAWRQADEGRSRDVSPSRLFAGLPFEECWELVPPPAGVQGEALKNENSTRIIALSKSDSYGQSYVSQGSYGRGVRIIRPDLAEICREAMAQGELDMDLMLALVDMAQQSALTELETRLWLEDTWRDGLRWKVLENEGGLYPHAVMDFGRIEKIEPAEGKDGGWRVTGFGQWMELNEGFGVTASSWTGK